MSEVTRETAGYFGVFAMPAFASTVSIGGISLNLSSNDAGAIRLAPQLAPFARMASVEDEVHLEVLRMNALGPSSGECRFDSGSLWKLFKAEEGLLSFDFQSPVLGPAPYKRLVIDPQFRCGKIFLSRQNLPPEATALEYPLDELVVSHRLALTGGAEIHGCGLVTKQGKGILFAGHSGAGKSSTARLWENMAAKILSDDRVILQKRSGPVRMLGTPWHGEAQFGAPESACLDRIYILEHGARNEFRELTPSAAAAELFARSFPPFYDSLALGCLLESLRSVTAQVPCFRFAFTPDSSAIDMVLRHDV